MWGGPCLSEGVHEVSTQEVKKDERFFLKNLTLAIMKFNREIKFKIISFHFAINWELIDKGNFTDMIEFEFPKTFGILRHSDLRTRCNKCHVNFKHIKDG